MTTHNEWVDLYDYPELADKIARLFNNFSCADHIEDKDVLYIINELNQCTVYYLELDTISIAFALKWIPEQKFILFHVGIGMGLSNIDLAFEKISQKLKEITTGSNLPIYAEISRLFRTRNQTRIETDSTFIEHLLSWNNQYNKEFRIVGNKYQIVLNAI